MRVSLRSWLAKSVNGPLKTLQKYDAPLEEATTPSLDALKAYSAGWRVLFSSGSTAAVPLFKRAIDIDPKFAVAYAALGRMYGDIGESTLSAENTAKAYELRDRAGDEEKYFITASYNSQIEGDLEQAEQTCELWVQTYPRALTPHGFLSGVISTGRGHYERSLREADLAIGLDPDVAIFYSNLALSDVALNRLDEAQAVLRRALERKLDIPDFAVQRYVIAFLKGTTRK
jgi:eukaryotic-like serine/threonine-protein kinase